MKKTVFLTLVSTLFLLTACGSSSTANTSNAEVNSTHAYISDGNALKIVDISNPSTPISQGSVTLNTPRFVSVSNDYAYVGEYATSDPYINIIDISNKTTPTLLTSISKTSTFQLISDMFIKDNIAYASDEYKGLHVLDITNGTFQAQALAGSDAMSVTLLNSDLFVIHQGVTAGLKKYDVSTATAPSFLLQIANPNSVDSNSYGNGVNTNSHHSWIENDGTHLYLANVKFKNFIKFDSSLTQVASVNTGGFVTALAIEGNYAYLTLSNTVIPLTGGFDGIKMINLSTMSVVDSKVLSKASGVTVQDNTLFVTDSTGLHIYDVSSGVLTPITTLAAGNGNFISLGK